VRDRVIELYREKYRGFDLTLAAEKLLKSDATELSENYA